MFKTGAFPSMWIYTLFLKIESLSALVWHGIFLRVLSGGEHSRDLIRSQNVDYQQLLQINII